MTGTDVREALHAVADATTPPVVDRLAFQRRVREERRRRTAGRTALGLAAAAVVAVGAVAAASLPGERADLGPTVTPHLTGTTDLQAPVHLVADGVLVAVDPQGTPHDLGPAEEVVGWTTESVYYVDRDSRLLRRDLSTSDEGPGGWQWTAPEPVVDGAVQSAQLSADGRWVGWIDLRERLHVVDLKAGTTAEPVQLEGSGYLADLAQGTGAPLVFDGRGLLLLSDGGPLVVPREGEGWTGVSATRHHVAVVEQSTTNVLELDGSRVRVVDTVPGHARLSPYGDALASVAGGQVTLWPADGDPVGLEVPGDAGHVAWGDDDTVLVATVLDGRTAVYACDSATAGEPCARLDMGEVQLVRLGR